VLVAGQLLGNCAASPDDACAIYNDAVDGSIVAPWPLLAPSSIHPTQSASVQWVGKAAIT
jgi:hypothetical protein